MGQSVYNLMESWLIFFGICRLWGTGREQIPQQVGPHVTVLRFLLGTCHIVLPGSVNCFLLVVLSMVDSIGLPCGSFYGSLLYFFLDFAHVTVSGKLPCSDCLRTPLNEIFKSSTDLQYVSFMVSSLNFLMTQLRMLKYDKPRWSSLPLHVVIFQVTQLWLIVWQSQDVQSSCIRANFPKISSSDTAKRMLISFLRLCPESHSKIKSTVF